MTTARRPGRRVGREKTKDAAGLLGRLLAVAPRPQVVGRTGWRRHRRQGRVVHVPPPSPRWASRVVLGPPVLVGQGPRDARGGGGGCRRIVVGRGLPAWARAGAGHPSCQVAAPRPPASQHHRRDARSGATSASAPPRPPQWHRQRTAAQAPSSVAVRPLPSRPAACPRVSRSPTAWRPCVPADKILIISPVTRGTIDRNTTTYLIEDSLN